MGLNPRLRFGLGTPGITTRGPRTGPRSGTPAAGAAVVTRGAGARALAGVAGGGGAGKVGGPLRLQRAARPRRTVRRRGLQRRVLPS